MAEVATYRAGQMVRTLFEILEIEPGGLPPAVALKRLAEQLPPTPFESAYYPNFPKIRRYEQLVRFHTIGAVKAGRMTKSGGIWLLTDSGRQAADYPDPVAFKEAEDKKYKAWKASQEDGRPSPCRRRLVRPSCRAPATSPLLKPTKQQSRCTPRFSGSY